MKSVLSTGSDYNITELFTLAEVFDGQTSNFGICQIAEWNANNKKYIKLTFIDFFWMSPSLPLRIDVDCGWSLGAKHHVLKFKLHWKLMTGVRIGVGLGSQGKGEWVLVSLSQGQAVKQAWERMIRWTK